MHFDKGSTDAGVEEDFFVHFNNTMALLVWQFFAYSDVLDPYILSVGLGTVSNLCRLWAIVRFQSHLGA